MHLPSHRPALRRLLWNAVEALPLPVFLVCMQATQPVASAEWRTTYFLSTATALVTTLVIWRRGFILNRLYLALNLYFLSGAIGLLAHWQSLNEWYGRMEATAMFLWVVTVGIVSTLFDKAGFIGVVADRQRVALSSAVVLGISMILTMVSWRFIGNDLWSAYVPFIVLFTVYAFLRNRMRQLATKGEGEQ